MPQQTKFVLCLTEKLSKIYYKAIYIRAQLKQDFCENVSDISLTILGTTWMGILCLYSGILESSLVRQQRIKSLIFLMTLYLPFIMWLRMPSAAALRLSTSNTLVLASYCPMSVNTSQCYLLKRCWRWFQIKLTSTRHENCWEGPTRRRRLDVDIQREGHDRRKIWQVDLKAADKRHV